jgi:chaperonin GroEL (HSP60 family)
MVSQRLPDLGGSKVVVDVKGATDQVVPAESRLAVHHIEPVLAVSGPPVDL